MILHPQPDPGEIEAAARHLERGALVVFPTETVYGLGADAENPQAVAKIYAAKGRPSNHPIIVHLSEGDDLDRWAASVPEEARKLADAFWPGPLTLILQRATEVPDAVSGGQGSIGLRCPAHPVAQALLKAFKGGRGGIAAPSANRFGHVSPTTAQHVRDEFPDEPLIASILDGGHCDVGIESTILDLSRLGSGVPPTLLRPGGIAVDELTAVLGLVPAAPTAAAPRASGTLEAHYAPKTPVLLLPGERLSEALHALHQRGSRAAVLGLTPEPADANAARQLTFFPMAVDRAQYAHDLYAALRNADHCGADIILVEAPPTSTDWSGINDRLHRAAFSSLALRREILGA